MLIRSKWSHIISQSLLNSRVKSGIANISVVVVGYKRWKIVQLKIFNDALKACTLMRDRRWSSLASEHSKTFSSVQEVAFLLLAAVDQSYFLYAAWRIAACWIESMRRWGLGKGTSPWPGLVLTTVSDFLLLHASLRCLFIIISIF